MVVHKILKTNKQMSVRLTDRTDNEGAEILSQQNRTFSAKFVNNFIQLIK